MILGDVVGPLIIFVQHLKKRFKLKRNIEKWDLIYIFAHKREGGKLFFFFKKKKKSLDRQDNEKKNKSDSISGCIQI